ncbi:MAG: DUF2953 domain-containing protein [Lachnospiraceae bacterium]|nr:DUF2953 domain-containing protein [Lachnospiraceae bacterium]
MHILLLILKIIGIVLLVLIGIVLMLVLLLVFVPFCYRAEGSYYGDKPYAMARVRYLFPFLQVLVRYKDGEAEGKVKVFGFTVYDLFSTKEEDTKSQKKDTEKEISVPASDIDADTDAETDAAEDISAPQEAEEISEHPSDDGDETEEKMSLREKIHHFISVIKEKISAIIRKLKDIKEKGVQIKEKVDSTVDKLKHYYAIWQEDYTQRAFQKAKKSLYKLWKSIRPRKGNVRLHFGTGDPGSTGQMCGYYGMLYPFLGKYVMIEPDFENKIYEGDFYFKGHITVLSFLKVVWIVLFDKDIKKLRKILMN